MSKTLIRIGVKLVILGTALAVLFAYVIELRVVHFNDMYPSVRDGQLCVVSQLSTPILDNIVLYVDPNGVEHLGRIVAQGGDIVEISDNSLRVNDNVVLQTIPFDITEGTLEYPYVVPEGAFFMMNDYREIENDSRVFGGIAADCVLGVLVFDMQYRGF